MRYTEFLTGVDAARSRFMTGVIALDDHNRMMAVCERCGSAYAARVLSDGRIRPIGVESCSCGSTDFQPLP